jgi:hypothetical protein
VSRADTGDRADTGAGADGRPAADSAIDRQSDPAWTDGDAAFDAAGSGASLRWGARALD